MRLSILSLPTLLLVACGAEPAADPQPAGGQATTAPTQEPAPPDLRTLPVGSGQVGLVTVKDAGVEVPARFQTVTGQVTLDLGDLNRSTADLTIDLASWDSGLELRDQRMKDVFFRVADKPTTVGFKLEGIAEPSGPLNDPGAKVTGKARGKLDWRGLPIPVEAPVELERTGPDTFQVRSTAPFQVSIAALGMSEPLQELITVCQHQAVDDSVRVTVDLQLGAAADAAPAAPADAAPADAAPSGG